MRLIASLVLFATIAALPAADGLNLDDLERAAQSNAGDAKRWSERRERMRADFAKVTALAERLNPEQRSQAWQRFLAAYADKDPYDNGDEELRRQARAALGGGNQPTPPEERADPALLATMRTAYDRAKSIDLLPGPIDAKRHAWDEFLARHGADLAGTRAGDEMRRWARLRLDGLAQTPPVLMATQLTVFPEFELDQGTQIAAVREHGLADRLGLRAGDTIIAAGQPPHDLVGDGDALFAYIAHLQREADLRLVVIRGDAVIAVPAASTPPVARGPVPARSGLHTGLRCLETPSTLIVGAVDAGQLGECAGLDAGDRIVAVQGAPVATVAALEAAIAGIAADAALELDIIRAGVRYRLNVPPAGGAAAWTVADPDAGWAPARPVAPHAPGVEPTQLGPDTRTAAATAISGGSRVAAIPKPATSAAALPKDPALLDQAPPPRPGREEAVAPAEPCVLRFDWTNYRTVIVVDEGSGLARPAWVVTDKQGAFRVGYQATAFRDARGRLHIDARHARLVGPGADGWSPDSFAFGHKLLWTLDDRESGHASELGEAVTAAADRKAWQAELQRVKALIGGGPDATDR